QLPREPRGVVAGPLGHPIHGILDSPIALGPPTGGVWSYSSSARRPAALAPRPSNVIGRPRSRSPPKTSGRGNVNAPYGVPPSGGVSPRTRAPPSRAIPPEWQQSRIATKRVS